MCHGELIFMNKETITTLGNTDLTITDTNITFTTQQLRENRHYNVTVTASNIRGQTASYIIISK